MKTLFTILSISLFGVMAQETLQLVHVVFRHGDRTPEYFSYPNDPYLNETYYPTGRGELILKGKQKAYKLGQILRSRYDSFLGNIYISNEVEAWSSDFNRTKATLLLVLAGLFPPAKEQMWDPVLNWQPIPFHSFQLNEDNLFLGLASPKFKRIFQKIMQWERTKPSWKSEINIIDYISKHSGLYIQSFWELFRIYDCLKTEQEYGLVLPKWTQKIFPYPLINFISKSYSLHISTSEMKKIVTGMLLKKIIDDSRNKINDVLPQEKRKIYLYSGHDLNIAFLLITMNVFRVENIPPYACFILFELHKVGNVTGFKLFYQDYESQVPHELKLPDCDIFCPLEKFASILKEYLPENL